MSTIRCYVKVNGEIRHEETFVNDRLDVVAVSYPGMEIMGQEVEVGFEFDPPLLTPQPLDRVVPVCPFRAHACPGHPCPFAGEAVREAKHEERERILLMAEIAAMGVTGRARTALKGFARTVRATDA